MVLLEVTYIFIRKTCTETFKSSLTMQLCPSNLKKKKVCASRIIF